jgi:hypothetical protein
MKLSFLMMSKYIFIFAPSKKCFRKKFSVQIGNITTTPLVDGGILDSKVLKAQERKK